MQIVAEDAFISLGLGLHSVPLYFVTRPVLGAVCDVALPAMYCTHCVSILRQLVAISVCICIYIYINNYAILSTFPLLPVLFDQSPVLHGHAEWSLIKNTLVHLRHSLQLRLHSPVSPWPLILNGYLSFATDIKTQNHIYSRTLGHLFIKSHTRTKSQQWKCRRRQSTSDC